MDWEYVESVRNREGVAFAHYQQAMIRLRAGLKECEAEPDDESAAKKADEIDLGALLDHVTTARAEYELAKAELAEAEEQVEIDWAAYQE